jgi:signal transduction histidine kinase
MKIRTIAAVTAALVVGATLAFADAATTKDDAIAMVKKAVALIKAEGPEKAYAAISAPGNQFVNGGTYAVVQGFDGMTLAHAANAKLVGKNMIDAQDVDGKYFGKDLAEHGKKEASFWYDFKFANPATKKIQVKDQYCESLNQTVVCAGVYRP